MTVPPGADPSAATLVRQLVDLLDVERIDEDLYRGARQPGGVGRVFGGQVVAQALQAAQRTIGQDKVAHALHACFMRPGDEDLPIVYRVARDFDGRSFATRRVTASQREQPILSLTASFQRIEDGLHHQDAMPPVPPPEAVEPFDAAKLDRGELPPILRRRLPLEFRPIPSAPNDGSAGVEASQRRWFRLCAPIEADPAMHRAILAYASDFDLIAAALLPHGLSLTAPGMQVASLDHALWLHEAFRVDDWLLYDSDSPWSGHARGFTRGRIFTRDGRLVASVAQEGLIRRRR